MSLVDLAVDGGVAHVTLSRPILDNKVTAKMMTELIEVLDAANESNANILLLRAEGSNFCVGRDQEEEPKDLTKRENLSMIFDANAGLTEFDGITVAAVHGKAMGFGSGIAVQSDITLASDNASFGFNEIKHGFAPTIVMTWLETYINRKTALDLLLTGRQVPAIEAQELGLTTQVIPNDQFDETVDAVIESLSAKNADALKTCKFYLREIDDVAPEDRREYALDTILDGM